MPLLAVGLGATALGTGLSLAGNKQAQDAVGKQRQKYNAEQTVLQKNAAGVFQNAAGNASVDNSTAALDKGTATRSAIAQALINSSTGATGPLPANDQPGYRVTGGNTAADRATAASGAWSNVVNGAADKLGSYGDLGTQQGIDNSNTNASLGVINSKARGNSNLLPLELEVASHKGDALSGWGKIVSALGSVASLGAASGLGAGSAALTTAQQAAQAGGGIAAGGLGPWGSIMASMAPAAAQWKF